MALIKCPECEKDVSSSAEVCIHCGYPIEKYMQLQTYEPETRRLLEKICPCSFVVPEPRAKVCIKCTQVFSSVLNNSFRKPVCNCKMPGVEIDYPELYSNTGGIPVQAFILENCVMPRNIGDKESEEYKTYVDKLYADMEKYGYTKMRTPPNPEYFGQDPVQYVPKSLRCPHCPICGSVSLSKLSGTKSFLKIAAFGLAGAGDVGKTWKCNKCGSKF